MRRQTGKSWTGKRPRWEVSEEEMLMRRVQRKGLRKEPENVGWARPEDKCLRNQNQKRKGVVRGVQYCWDIKVWNIFSAIFNQELLGNFNESGLRGVEESGS